MIVTKGIWLLAFFRVYNIIIFFLALSYKVAKVTYQGNLTIPKIQRNSSLHPHRMCGGLITSIYRALQANDTAHNTVSIKNAICAEKISFSSRVRRGNKHEGMLKSSSSWPLKNYEVRQQSQFSTLVHDQILYGILTIMGSNWFKYIFELYAPPQHLPASY